MPHGGIQRALDRAWMRLLETDRPKAQRLQDDGFQSAEWFEWYWGAAVLRTIRQRYARWSNRKRARP